MRLSFRALSMVLVLAWLAVLARGTRAAESPEERLKAGHCPCHEGQACWHYLRTPLRPPEDPCRCGLCAAKGDCSSKDRPEGWGATCMGSQRPPCFWRRHAASWGISCAVCASDTECDACNELPGRPDGEVLTALKKQVEIEGGIWPGSKKNDPDANKKRTLVAWSPHFYLATDIPQLKLFTQGGAPRVADQHEVLHLFLERAEKAYADWISVWGEEFSMGKPVGIYLAQRVSKKEAWQAAYFGHQKTNMIYGGGSTRVGGGFCWNGFATSGDEESSDRDLHAHVRHMVGHLLFSCWHSGSPDQKHCPKWAFVGAADWLCKFDPMFVDWTTFCHDEGGGATGSGKDWDKKARAIAANRHDPIEKLFDVASLSHLSYDDHVRSWSYMDTMLREDRERWLKTMRAIRDGKEPAVAFQEGLEMTPDEFDKRWVDRMSGKRKTMAEVPKDATVPDADGPNAAARRRLREEQDITTLGALIRGLDHVTDVKTAELVLSRLSLDSDLIRETVVMLLSKTENPEVLQWLRTAGIADHDALVRAHVARVLGNLKDAASRPTFEAMLDDQHWLVRANAAGALAALADPASAPALIAKIEDPNPKAWIAKADAAATLGPATSKATLAVASKLNASDWQVRLTACRALAKMGDKDAVDALIDRLDIESGRLRNEIHRALKAVTHENFGPNPQTWREWWKKQKPSGLPPEPPKVDNPEDERYAKPKPLKPDEASYYGRRIFSQSILFVLDLSKSMETYMEVPPEAQAKLGKLPKGPRILVAKEAIKQALLKLDDRTRFNVVFFSTRVRPWQKSLVVAGGMKQQAASTIDGQALEDETNIFGALRAAVGLHEKATITADLDPIPDTIYFLTDGTPTRGEITDTETILSWMRDVNRFAKVDIHVIAMGSIGLDLPFLQRLAEENGGEFIHVPDNVPK